MAELPQELTCYGIHPNDLSISLPGYSNHQDFLVQSYFHSDCDFTASSTATSTFTFIYPYLIAHTFFIEGLVEGHVTYTSTATSTCTSFTVNLIKIHQDTTKTTLDSYTKTVSDSITTSSYVKYPFYFQILDKEEITSNERIGIEITTTCANTIYLSYDNDSTNEDIKVTFPLILV